MTSISAEPVLELSRECTHTCIGAGALLFVKLILNGQVFRRKCNISYSRGRNVLSPVQGSHAWDLGGFAAVLFFFFFFFSRSLDQANIQLPRIEAAEVTGKTAVIC